LFEIIPLVFICTSLLGMGNTYTSPQYAAHNQQEANSTIRPANPNEVNINVNNNGHINNPHVLNNTNRVEIGGGPAGVLNLRADLASLLSLNNYRNNFPLPSIHETTAIKVNVNLNKDTIHLIRDESNPNMYRVQFVYDSCTPCVIKVYFMAKEALGLIQGRTEFTPVSGEKGFGVVFTQPPDQAFDLSPYKPDELSATVASTMFPIAITLHSLPEEPLKNDPTILHQITFATLLHCADDSYAIKVISQKIVNHGQVYNLHDIYGLDYTGERETEGSRECVVCMSEPRDTTILPCSHMCLCAACAEMMRTQTNKCPICRAPVKKLLTIRLSGANAATTSLSGESPKLSDEKTSGDDEYDKEDELLPRRERITTTTTTTS